MPTDNGHWYLPCCHLTQVRLSACLYHSKGYIFMGIYGNEENFSESGYERNYPDVIFCQVEVFGHEIQIN